MKVTALAIALIVGTPAIAQLVNPAVPIDTSAFATKDDITGVQSTIAPACATAPANGTLAGAVGTAPICTPHADANAQTPVQAGNTTLAANCTWSISFARSFVSSVPLVWASVIDSSGTQMPCKVQTRSSTAATGICAPAQATVLNLSIVTSGLSLSPFASTCTAGLAVMVGGREPTQ